MNFKIDYGTIVVKDKPNYIFNLPASDVFENKVKARTTKASLMYFENELDSVAKTVYSLNPAYSKGAFLGWMTLEDLKNDMLIKAKELVEERVANKDSYSVSTAGYRVEIEDVSDDGKKFYIKFWAEVCYNYDEDCKEIKLFKDGWEK